MKITYYGYNSFLVESVDKKIAIDPGGGLFFLKGWLKSLLPESEWKEMTHIFVTHGDPDHYWHVDRLAQKSGAPVICNKAMVREINSRNLLLGPRDRGLAFTTDISNVHTVSPGEKINVDGVGIKGIQTAHGPLMIKIGPFTKTLKSGPEERMGWGSIGFELRFNNKVIVNLGDTLIHRDEWKAIDSPDVLMIPIGGATVHNTMDEKEALETVEMMKPKMVIPCHYNCSAFHKKNANPADDLYFQDEVKKRGFDCAIVKIDESIIL